MSESQFVHLHVHTAYSLLDGAARVKDLLVQAAAFEMPAVAITDHGSLFGVLDFYQKAKAAGIKPILGCEVYVAPGSRQDRKGKAEHNHLVLLAENNQGYKNLIQLVTRAHLEGFYYRPRVDKELLAGVERRPHCPVRLPPRRGGPAPEPATTRRAPRPRPGNTPRSSRGASTWSSRPTNCRSSSR